MNKKISFLVFKDWNQSRRANKSFDGTSNIGAYMLIDVAKRRGIDIGFCSVDTARQNQIVLVSLTSIYDALAFYREVRRHKDWQKGTRKFRVLCGGFGLQNPFPLIEYVDEFWFGRCENEFVEWLTIRDYEHPSLMLADKPKVCRINQSSVLYPNKFQLNTGIRGCEQFCEEIMGCPNKCYFCHFSFSRKYIKTSTHYNLGQYKNTPTQEIDAFNIDDVRPTTTHLTIGLDGVSERIRFLVNKRISDDLLMECIEKYAANSTTTGKALFLKLYNISGYESETDEDFETLVDVCSKVETRLKKRILLTLHTTPLHPSPATPVVFAPVDLQERRYQRDGGGVFFGNYEGEQDRLICFHSRFNPSIWSLLESVVIERFSEKYRNLLDTICFNSKFRTLKVDDKLKCVQDKFDIGDLVREYSTDEQVPSYVCESYIGWDTIKKLRDGMKKKLNEK